jgi:outer membrane protein
MKKAVLFLITTAFVSSGQNRWDLQQCINYAITHNISLKQTSLNNEAYKNNYEQSEASILPTLNAGATHNYNFGKTIDRYTNTLGKSVNTQFLSQNFYITSSVVLWSGFSQYNNMKATEYTYLSGVERLKQQEYDLSLNVANAYIGIIFSEELLKISQNQYNITKEQLERTLKLVNAGAAAKSVEYDIKAQLANEEVNVITAENNYQLTLLSLRQLMNLDSVADFSVIRPEINMPESPQVMEKDIQYIYESSLKSQPSIKSAEYSILSAEKNLAVSRGRMSPTLTFNASMGTGTSGLAKKQIGSNMVSDTLGSIPNFGPLVYSREDPVLINTPLGEQFKNNANKTLGFTLNIPLFNGLQTHTSIKNAKIAAFNAKLTQDLTKQNLYKNIAQAFANAKAALNKYNASSASVDAANESFKYAQQKFNAGVISAIDFSTAKNRLFAAESNMLQAKYDYVFKLKVLDYYEGKPLGF